MSRALVWCGAGALVVLLARALAYALVPSPLAVELRGRVGGPTLPVVSLAEIGRAHV